MYINDFCAPALLYIAFSLTHIIIDVFKQLYNTALVKFIVMIIFTFLLNILCQRGLTVISWFIVFIPFITMTIITTLLLITFGLSPFSGKIDTSTSNSRPSGNSRQISGNSRPISGNSRPQKQCKDTEQQHEKFYN